MMCTDVPGGSYDMFTNGIREEFPANGMNGKWVLIYDSDRGKSQHDHIHLSQWPQSGSAAVSIPLPNRKQATDAWVDPNIHWIIQTLVYLALEF